MNKVKEPVQTNPALEEFSDAEYDKKTFNLSKGEQLMIAALDVQAAVYSQQQQLIAEMLKVPQSLLSGFLNKNVLPRIGVKQIKDNGLFYDTMGGTITVCIPKKLCSICESAKATDTHDSKDVCAKCKEMATAVQETKLPN